MNGFHALHRMVAMLPMPGATRFACRRAIFDKQYAAEKRAIKASGDREKLESLHNDWRFEFQMLDEEERAFYSRKLMRKARRMRVIVPQVYEGSELTADYEENHILGGVHLTLQGENKVRAAIREEEKLRAERWGRRIPYFTAITGLLGTLTGLAAVIDKWGR